MKTSIAMATYNGAAFLQAQLDSFVNQTRVPDELVIFDDASTDNSLEIIDQFKKRSPFPVRVTRNHRNVGYTENFSRAIMQCTHDLIFLADQDDVWFPEKIEHVVNLALSHEDKHVFITDAELTDSDLNGSANTKLQQVRNAGLSDDFYVTGCCVAARHDFMAKVMPVPQNCTGHDIWIAMVSITLNVRWVEPLPMQYHRRHENNTSTGIANGLNRNYKLSRIKYQLRNCNSGINVKRMRNIIRHQQALLALVKTIPREEFDSNLTGTKIALIEKQLAVTTNRLAITKEKVLLVRLVKGIVFFCRGQYRSFSGFSSLLCDLLSPRQNS